MANSPPQKRCSRTKLGPQRYVTKTRNAFDGKDIIERTESGYAFLDPGFDLWFKREILRKKVRVLEVDEQ